jgi:hypothetical protein
MNKAAEKAEKIEKFFAPALKAYGIKVPRSVDEFRANLIKYYECAERTIKPTLVVAKIEGDFFNKTLGKRCDVRLDSIKSVGDIYKATGTGWGPGANRAPTFALIPKAKLTPIGEAGYEMEDGVRSFLADFRDPNAFELLDKGEYFYPMDDQNWRWFYAMTLGSFSGYGGF